MKAWGSSDIGPDHGLKMGKLALIPRTILFHAIGKHFTVDYTKRKGGGLELIQATASGLVVNCNVDNRKGCLALLRLWLQYQGRLHLVPWIEKISRRTGLTFKAVQIRGQKTRWGSCSSRGTISLNCKLLFLPQSLVNYLIIHELCHTVHLNHSPNFWSFLSSFEPNCKTLDAEMKGAGHFVPPWVSWGK
jgi:predicted metal-dependent hydrolase